MDVYNYSNQDNSSNTTVTSEISKFDNHAFMEYKRRVFQQLAEEYDKEKQQQKNNPVIDVSHMAPDADNLHASNHCQGNPVTNTDKLCQTLSDLQPSWDDSDLQTDSYVLPSSSNFINNTLPLQKNYGSKAISQDVILKTEKLSKSDNDLNSNETGQPLMDWPFFDKQIKLKSSKAESDDSFWSSDSVEVTSPSTTRSWRAKKMSFQKQKRDREVIRQKLSMTEPGDDNDFKPGKPWSRSYSSSSHLHICYINDSSDDSDVEVDKPYSGSSPLITPASPGMRSYGKNFMGCISDSSFMSLSTLPNNAIIQRTHQETRPVRSKQEELEMEARYQLARAHERAKALAEQEKLREKSENQLSLAHRVLSCSLNDETGLKMKEYSLTRADCRMMTLGQLQLLLNDMHARKQALNQQLMALLISRDEYQTEQDAKLVDVDDLKSMMSEIGPETTV